MLIWRIIIVVLLVAAVGGFSLWQMFQIPSLPQVGTLSQANALLNSNDPLPTCYYAPEQQAPMPVLDQQGQINLLVWNIHKQTEENWQQELQHLSQGRQLILLQEASISAEFKQWLSQQAWGANYVNAFKVFDVSAGVLNLASVMPNFACAYIEQEPWLQLPKSGLYARYDLSNGQQLAVINIHAVNFTLGTKDFLRQIEALKQAVTEHQGPLIVAGDFNTWSQARTEKLASLMAELQLQQVAFEQDKRKVFVNGLPLDHIFYRGLQLHAAQAVETQASDHNPMLVNFSLVTSNSDD